MKKVPNFVENCIIALFYRLIIHFGTIKPESVTNYVLILQTFDVLLCS